MDVNPYIELTLYSSAEVGVSEKDFDGVIEAGPEPTPLAELGCDFLYLHWCSNIALNSSAWWANTSGLNPMPVIIRMHYNLPSNIFVVYSIGSHIFQQIIFHEFSGKNPF